MQQDQPTKLLSGCLLETPTKWPGLVKLLETATEEQFKLLSKMPGAHYTPASAKSGVPATWYLPQSLVDLGKYPGLLHQYSDDQSAITPNGERILREHQLRAVSFIREATPQREGCILGADAGTGKSTAALQALELDGLLDKPGIVVAPLMAAAAWLGPDSDITKHFGTELKQLTGRKDPDTTQLSGYKHFFINYDILEAWWAWLTSNIAPVWVIFDELHLLMHATTHRANAAYNLSLWHSIERRIGLTGTPIPNNRLNLWSQLRVVQPRQWSNTRHDFGVRFCGGHKEIAAGREGDEREFWNYSGETNDIELRARLAGTLLRYTREEVSEGLPILTREVVRLQPNSETIEEYKSAELDIIAYLKDKGQIETGPKTINWGGHSIKLKAAETKPSGIRLRAIGTLIGLLSEYKAREAARIASEALANHSHVVVFSWRKAASATIVEHLRSEPNPKGIEIIGPIDGTMKQKERQKQAKQFAKAGNAIYVATLGAAGMALNDLVRGSSVIFSDLNWNPAVLIQAEARIYRDGSPNKNIVSKFLCVDGTIDTLLIHHLTHKANAAATVSPNDVISVGLVGDLSLDRNMTSEESLNHICSVLSEMESI